VKQTVSRVDFLSGTFRIFAAAASSASRPEDLEWNSSAPASRQILGRSPLSEPLVMMTGCPGLGPRLDAAADLAPGEAGHVLVEDDQVGELGGRLRERAQPIRRRDDLEPASLEEGLVDLELETDIVREQDLERLTGHGVRRPSLTRWRLVPERATRRRPAPYHRSGRGMQLAIEGVTKVYRGGVTALREFSLALGPGVLGLLGPNGAGKSTLMRILATVARPTRGRVTWDGGDVAADPNRIRRVLGYLPQDFGVYPNLDPVEFLSFLAAAKGIPPRAARARIDELLELVNLVDARRRPLGGFSGGMRQRVGIAQALLGDPKLLIVDEPTAGLDPEERVRFRNLLGDLSGERIVILSTHVVSDVEAIATSIAIIAAGRLVRFGSPEEMLAAVERRVWEAVVPSADLQAARERFLIGGTIRRGDGVHLRIVGDEPPLPGARPLPPSLEDAYLWLVARSRSADAA
jgi:ABC-type multidrug transport system ATPase subunit